METTLAPEPGKLAVWRQYSALLFVSLVVLLLSLFLFLPVTVTLDGYSHLYGAQLLRSMLAGQPDVHRNFTFNSILVPNWFDALLLAALSKGIPYELALKLLMVLIGTALFSSLYFCVDAMLYPPPQRAQVLIVLLPFALNAYLTLGYYGFLISSSLCLCVLGLLLRHGLRLRLRLQFLTACLLVVAYFAHPVPVIISFLFPCAYFIADALLQWREGRLRFAATVKRHALDSWPGLPAACVIPWFYLRLAKAPPPPGLDAHAHSMTFTVTHRLEMLFRDALTSIAPSANAGTLFIALLSVLLAGVVLSPRQLSRQNPLRFASLAVLVVATMIGFLLVPDQVGDGAFIANRFLLHAAIFLVLLALTGGVFSPRLLTLCSLIAALLVAGFAEEYVLAARRLEPQVAEVRSAMAQIPSHSRILILGYRMTPSSCPSLPLLQVTIPERHWALAGALKNELIVLNDYQANTSHFPLKALTSRYAGVIGEVDLTSDDLSDEQKGAAWRELLKGDPGVDFIVSWGVSRKPDCRNSVDPPFEEELKNRYDRVFFKESRSRVELWRKRN
jgi:hypothetical protein